MAERIVQWDWREQPDINEIRLALGVVFDGSTCPSVALVEDTASDQMAVVVSGRPLDGREVQAIFDGTCEACRFDDHGECSGGCLCECDVKPRRDGSQEGS